MKRDILRFVISHLDELIDAPEGLDRARELIVESAVTGTLVPRIDSEGTGHEVVKRLLERVAATSPRKAIRGEIKEAHRFAGIPDSWALTPLGDIAMTISDGTHKTPTYVEAGIPFLSIKDISSGRIDFSNTRFITQAEHEVLTKRVEPRRGDILFCRIGTLGIPVVVETDQPFSIFVSLGLIRVDAELILPEYLALLLNSPVMYRIYDEVKAGGSHTNKLNLATVKQLPIPIPPTGEQRRIVERLKQVLQLFSELESAQAAKEAVRTELTASSMSSLACRRDTFALKHLEELVRTQADATKLELAVLELATRGYLTQSHENEIRVEGFLDWTSQTLDISKPLSIDEGIQDLFELPDGWHWVRLGAVLTDIKGGWSPNAQPRPKTGDEWGVLKVSACSWGEFRPSENKALMLGQVPRPDLEVRSGDFLICRANTAELVGRSVVVADTPSHLMLSDKTLRLSVVPGCNPRYLNLANLASVARSHYEREATGTSSSMKNVSQSVIRQTPIPLPPPAEQDQIVAVVDQLMALVGRLRFELAA